MRRLLLAAFIAALIFSLTTTLPPAAAATNTPHPTATFNTSCNDVLSEGYYEFELLPAACFFSGVWTQPATDGASSGAFALTSSAGGAFQVSFTDYSGTLVLYYETRSGGGTFTVAIDSLYGWLVSSNTAATIERVPLAMYHYADPTGSNHTLVITEVSGTIRLDALLIADNSSAYPTQFPYPTPLPTWTAQYITPLATWTAQVPAYTPLPTWTSQVITPLPTWTAQVPGYTPLPTWTAQAWTPVPPLATWTAQVPAYTPLPTWTAQVPATWTAQPLCCTPLPTWTAQVPAYTPLATWTAQAWTPVPPLDTWTPQAAGIVVVTVVFSNYPTALPTLTPTDTLTPSETYTPSPTNTPDNSLIYATVAAPGESDGQAVVFRYQIDAGQIAIFTALTIQIVLILVLLIYFLRKGGLRRG